MRLINRNNGVELNSGKLQYGTKRSIRDRLKKVTGTEFVANGELYYKTMSLKNSYYTQYFGIEDSIDLKVMVYKTRDLKESHLIKIKGEYYDITTLDEDLEGRYVYLYLQKKKGGLDD